MSNGPKYLTQKEVAALLNLPRATIKRWEQQGKIPYKVIKNKRCFKRNEIIEWAKAHEFTISLTDIAEKGNDNIDLSLSGAVERGGLYFDIDGSDLESVINNCVKHLDYLNDDFKAELVSGILDREALATTGIGNGVAIPHTRNRIDFGLECAHIPLFLLKKPIDFQALDGRPVQSLFILITTSTKEHLRMLAKISRLLQAEAFLSILETREGSLAAIIKSINDDTE